jgi:RimJ/RimL family protein N-acetyltransferase
MIRPANLIDVPRMVELGQIMHAESRYQALRFDPAKFARVIESLIDYPDGLAIVAVKGGQVIGGFLGIAEEHFFSPDKFSFDLATFIDPAHRGGFVAANLLRAYVKWAQGRGIACVNAGVASGINHEVSVRLYERIGFAHTGVTLEYQGRTR